MGNEFAERTWMLLIIHTITYGLMAIYSVSWQMTEGLGYPNFNFILFLLCLLITVSLIIGLTPSLGSLGIAIARMVGCAVIFFSIFYVEKWFFGKIQFKFWLKIISILAISSAAAILTEKLIIQILPENWLGFVIATTGGGIIYFSIVLLLGFVNADEKLLFKKLLNR
jgi:O-antigen/teichoic acid export membrane protein